MKKFNEPGHIHFITARTFKNIPFFKDEKCCKLFLENLKFYRTKFDLKIHAYCIIPNHVHLLTYFDLDKYPNLTVSQIMQNIKSAAARQIINYYKTKSGSREPLLSARIPGTEQGLRATRTRRGHKRGLKYQIWQSGFYDFNIYSDKKFEEKLKYIHDNPIKHGLTDNISKYKYCSWRNYELNDHSIFKIDYPEC